MPTTPQNHISVLIARGDEILRDDTAEGCTARTRFQLASVSKSFTAAAVLLLAERGTLDLDDSVTRWIGRCPRSWQGITLHQLLTHTSGLGHWREHPMIDLERSVTPGDLLDTFGRVPPLSAPGARWHYSSPGYVLAAHVAQRAADRPYRELLAETIFGPLGLGQTFAGSVGDRTDVARGHGTDGRPVPSWDLDVVSMGAGDVWSTTGDLLAWIDALRTGRVLGERYRTVMFAEPVPTGGGPDASGYGCGWFVGAHAGEAWFHHSGENAGFRAFAACLPGSGRRIVALSNSDRTGPSVIAELLAGAHIVS
ncbi:MAG TPA: serine hydrolase domain-containing protein [Actinoplanes sp.]|jgi:CubicO group peptidase (beta-lactamase class C family)